MDKNISDLMEKNTVNDTDYLMIEDEVHTYKILGLSLFRKKMKKEYGLKFKEGGIY